MKLYSSLKKITVSLFYLLLSINFLHASNPYVGIWKTGNSYLQLTESRWIHYGIDECGIAFEEHFESYTLCGDTIKCPDNTELISGWDCAYDGCVLKRDADSMIMVFPWGAKVVWQESVLPEYVYDSHRMEELQQLKNQVETIHFDSAVHFVKATILDTMLQVKLNDLADSLPNSAIPMEMRVFALDSVLQVKIYTDVTWPISKIHPLPVMQIKGHNIVLIDTPSDHWFNTTTEIVDIMICYQQQKDYQGRRYVEICDDVLSDTLQYNLNFDVQR